jgi:photosystem II stability/assembly factor-like uncharacterized protein
MRHFTLTSLIVFTFSFNIFGQWTDFKSLTGGSIVTSILEFNADIYAAVGAKGIYQSKDDGQTWSLTDVPGQSNFVHLIEHNNELLAFSHSLIWRTVDGETWTHGPGPANFVNAVGSDGTNIYVATISGIYKSPDGGVSWNKIPDPLTDIYIASLAVSGSTIWATGGYENLGELLRSDDGGQSWIKIEKGSSPISQVLINNGSIFINALDGIFKSSDDGASWVMIKSQGAAARLFFHSDKLYYFSNFKLSISSNEGLSWNSFTKQMPGYNINSMYVNDDFVFIGCWGGGVFKADASTEGEWINCNDGINAADVADIEVLDDNVFIGIQYSFIRSSNDEGVTWMQAKDQYDFQGGNARGIMKTGTDLYVYGDSYILRSSDKGATWQYRDEGIRNQLIFGITSTTSHIVATTERDIFLSDDHGATWIKKPAGISPAIRSVYSDGVNIYLETWSGLFRSTTNGDSWEKISSGLSNESIECLINIGDVLFAGTSEGLYKTSNGGATWELSLDGPAYTLAARGTDLFLGSNHGNIFFSSDLGETWTDISGGLPDALVTAIDFTDSFILSGSSYAGGLWKRNATEIIGPYLKAYSVYSDNRFKIGESVFIKSDQALYTPNQTILTSTDIYNYLTIKNSQGKIIPYTAEIDAAGKLITINIDEAVEGEAYTLYVNALNNMNGLTSPALQSKPFTAFDNPVTAIGDEISTNRAKVYPNPVAGVFTVDIPDRKNGSYSLAIYDMLGRQVKWIPASGISSFPKEMDISELPDGRYLVIVDHSGQQFLEKIVKR